MKKNFSFLVVFTFLVTALILGFTLSDVNDEKPKTKSSKYISTKQNDQTPVTKDLDYRTRNPFVEQSQQNQTDGNPNYSQASLSESFEGATFPPTGWIKLNPDGGTGWNQQTSGTTPVPGWNGGIITTPVGGGTKTAFSTWTTGGAVSNDQWLVTPQLTGVVSTDQLKFSLRYWPNSFRDSIEVLLSTTGNTIPNFTNLIFRKNFAVATIDTGWINYTFPLSAYAGQNVYIAFREVVADNFNDGASFSLDLVSVGTGSPNDIATISVDNPTASVLLPTSTIAPKASFKNVGTSSQTNVPVTYNISGPVAYSNSKLIASIAPGATVQVTFDSTFNPTAGTYNTTVFCSLGSDANRSNDTLKTSFSAVNPNYGTQSGTSFANNFATGAPSMPEFCWKDTTGSQSLCVNAVNTRSGVYVGSSLDDGYWKIGNALNGKKIRMGGVSYDSFFVSTNGIVGLSNNTEFQFYPDLGSDAYPAYYPLWMDFDFRTSYLSSRVSYKVINDYQLLISYDRALQYNANVVVPDAQVSFQVVIELVDASSTTNSRMVTQMADGTGSRTGSVFFTDYNNDALGPQVMGMQTAGLAETYYRAAYPLFFPGPMFGPGNTQLAVEYGSNPNVLNQTCSAVGFAFTGSIEAMTPFATGDTINVQLRGNTSPYAVIDAIKGYMNGSGVLNGVFEKGGSGSYYVRFNHRNALETWSSGNVTPAGLSASYDFTTGIGQAFGSNMVMIGGEASFYSGDVNKDNVIDLSDGSDVDNDAFNFISGYVNTDVNNDLVVDLTDAAYVDNNAFNFVAAVIP